MRDAACQKALLGAHLYVYLCSWMWRCGVWEKEYEWESAREGEDGCVCVIYMYTLGSRATCIHVKTYQHTYIYTSVHLSRYEYTPLGQCSHHQHDLYTCIHMQVYVDRNAYRSIMYTNLYRYMFIDLYRCVCIQVHVYPCWWLQSPPRSSILMFTYADLYRYAWYTEADQDLYRCACIRYISNSLWICVQIYIDIRELCIAAHQCACIQIYIDIHIHEQADVDICIQIYMDICIQIYLDVYVYRLWLYPPT